jgi:hypothetical protein
LLLGAIAAGALSTVQAHDKIFKEFNLERQLEAKFSAIHANNNGEFDFVKVSVDVSKPIAPYERYSPHRLLRCPTHIFPEACPLCSSKLASKADLHLVIA